jgi:hypothetical protein
MLLRPAFRQEAKASMARIATNESDGVIQSTCQIAQWVWDSTIDQQF